MDILTAPSLVAPTPPQRIGSLTWVPMRRGCWLGQGPTGHVYIVTPIIRGTAQLFTLEAVGVFGRFEIGAHRSLRRAQWRAHRFDAVRPPLGVLVGWWF